MCRSSLQVLCAGILPHCSFRNAAKLHEPHALIETATLQMGAEKEQDV